MITDKDRWFDMSHYDMTSEMCQQLYYTAEFLTRCGLDLMDDSGAIIGDRRHVMRAFNALERAIDKFKSMEGLI